MSESVPVTPALLRWARESAGLTIDDVVNKLSRKKITREIVEEWESGGESPTYPQLERLAYEIYKRPLAIFFFPEPPEEVTPNQSFRTLPTEEIDNLPPRILLLLRKAGALQLNLRELYDDVNPASRNIVKEVSFDPKDSEITLARKVRDFIAVSLDDQSKCSNSDDAFSFWRKKIEDLGVFVFKDAFKEDLFSGFCLYDKDFPLIYVNNSKPFTRQIFTLFHELAHLFFRTGGIDTRRDDYISLLRGNSRRIEVLCNKFAGEFLVPISDFKTKIANRPVDDTLINEMANLYNVSREVILRRLFDMGFVDQTLYEKKTGAWKREHVKGRGSGGNYYKTQGVYIGKKYLQQAFNRYYRNQIGIKRLAGYLGVKVRNVPGMEALLTRRGAAI